MTAASGDDGSSDGAPGNNVDFPASSPWVLACGGTTLTANTGRTLITNEVVWNNNTGGTGGGVSLVFSKPAYQTTTNIIRRGVPDVAGNADPNTGYILYHNGEYVVVGGTSAVSPLWAGLIGRIYQNIAPSTINLIQTKLYATQGVCRDITIGNNGAFGAAIRWDACTGLGSPLGQAIQNVFNGNLNPTPSIPLPVLPVPPVAQFIANKTIGTGLMTVTFTDKSTNSPTSWLWRFGDGSISTVKNPVHRYSRGTYTVNLTATNSGGANMIKKVAYIKVK